MLPPGFAPRAFQAVASRYPGPPIRTRGTTNYTRWVISYVTLDLRSVSGGGELFCSPTRAREEQRVKLGKDGHGKPPSTCAISGLRSGVKEIFALLGCYIAFILPDSHRRFGTDYWSHLQGSRGTTGCSETSVTTNQNWVTSQKSEYLLSASEICIWKRMSKKIWAAIWSSRSDTGDSSLLGYDAVHNGI